MTSPKFWLGGAGGPYYGYIKGDTPPSTDEDMVRLIDLLDSVGYVNTIEVSDINNPTELNSIAGPSGGTGTKLIITYAVYSDVNLMTLYMWDSAASSGTDSPYVLAADGGGYWVALAGRHMASPSARKVRVKQAVSEYLVSASSDADDYYAREYWIEGGPIMWDSIMGSSWDDLRRWSYNQGGGTWVQYLKMDHEGIFGVPYQSRARAYFASGTLAHNATPSVIPFDTENWDIQGEFNTSTYRFTATRAGLYHATAKIAVDFTGVNGTLGLYFYKNGTVVTGHAQTIMAGASYESLQLSDDIYLAVGDYVDVRALQLNSGSGTLNFYGGSPYCFFSIFKAT